MANKSTFKLSLKCFLNSLFLIIVSISLFMPFSLIGGKTAELYHGGTMFIIYAVFYYQICWKMGWDDIGKVKRGAEKENIFRGFYSCFIGTLPGTLPLIIRIFNEDIPLVNFVNGIINFGFGGFAINDNDTYILLVHLALILISGAAYLLGYKEISLYRLIVYKKEK
ncbi:MAG: hypothetical protein IKZ25_00755 [Clostridia bacterium]|nr:hypothetical protein [Clostridia bacterium]